MTNKRHMITRAYNQSSCLNYEHGDTKIGVMGEEDIFDCKRFLFGCNTCDKYQFKGDELKEAIQTQQMFNDHGKETALTDHLGHEPI